MTFKLTLSKNTDVNMIITPRPGNYKVMFDKLHWKIPNITPNLETSVFLSNQLASNEIVPYEWESFKTYKSNDYDSAELRIDFPGVQHKPKYIYIVFQKVESLSSVTGK